MYQIPKTFDSDQLVGQTFYSLIVTRNLIQLNFGRDSSLKNGKYADYVRIDVEFGLEVRRGGLIERYLQGAPSTGQLRYAAGALADVLDKRMTATAIEQSTDLQITFENHVQIVILAGQLESFHIHTPKESITV